MDTLAESVCCESFTKKENGNFMLNISELIFLKKLTYKFKLATISKNALVMLIFLLYFLMHPPLYVALFSTAFKLVCSGRGPPH